MCNVLNAITDIFIGIRRSFFMPSAGTDATKSAYRISNAYS